MTTRRHFFWYLPGISTLFAARPHAQEPGRVPEGLGPASVPPAEQGQDGIPVVLNDATRGRRFPSPRLNQRVHNLAAGNIEHWDGSNWGTVFTGTLADKATIRAALFPGDTPEKKIQAAIDAAAAAGLSTVEVSAELLPYSPSEVRLDTRVHMTRQGVDPSVYDVLAYGASGDGETDDTAAIIAATEACPENGTLLFPSARSYRIGLVQLEKNMVVEATGSRFLLNGRNAGFAVQSVITSFCVSGGTYVGSGDAADNQIAWLFGNVPEADIANVLVDNIRTQDCTVGVKVAGTPETPVRNVTVRNSAFVHSVGLFGGTGYGFHVHHGDYAKSLGNHFERCERHGLYFSMGKHYVAATNSFKDHRSTIATGQLRVAFSISRSDNVTAVNNLFDNCYDGTVGIDTDSQGRNCRNVTLTGNTFVNSRTLDLLIGGAAPSSEGHPRSVVVSGNTFRRDPGIPPRTTIDLQSGAQVNIANNNFFHESTGGGTFACIYLRGSEDQQYTDGVFIHGNIFRADSSIANAYALEVGSNIAQGSSVVEFTNNMDQSKDGILFNAELTNSNFRTSD